MYKKMTATVEVQIRARSTAVAISAEDMSIDAAKAEWRAPDWA